MKILILLLVSLLFNHLQAQEGTFEYRDFDCYEGLKIKKDSFCFEHSCGLMWGKIYGSIVNDNDTLILNSVLQPFQEIRKSYTKNANNNNLRVTLLNSTYKLEDIDLSISHDFGFRYYDSSGEYVEVDLNDLNFVEVNVDSVSGTKTYIFNSDIISKGYKLYFIVYRTNIEFELDFEPTKINDIKISFNDLPEIVDYYFFTNQRIIYSENGLIFLINSKPEETYYTFVSKEGIRVSKDKRIKEYKKAPNKR